MKKLALLAAALAPLLATAQEAAPAMPEDPRAPRFREVERGFFTGFEAGWLWLLKTPAATDPVRFPFARDGGGTANGALVGVNAGYDLTDRFALSAFALGNNSRASVSYGAFTLLVAGGDLRGSIAAWRDRYGTERWYLYLHARAGYLLTRPEGLFGTNDVYLAGGPGLAYHTHLRHFSLGLGADFAYLTKAKTAGIAPVLSVRYTF